MSGCGGKTVLHDEISGYEYNYTINYTNGTDGSERSFLEKHTFAITSRWQTYARVDSMAKCPMCIHVCKRKKEGADQNTRMNILNDRTRKS